MQEKINKVDALNTSRKNAKEKKYIKYRQSRHKRSR